MGKTNAPVYTRLLPIALEALRSIKPKSAEYFFWSGRGLDSGKADWSEKMLKLYRAAGITRRNHAWRDTATSSEVFDLKPTSAPPRDSVKSRHGEHSRTDGRPHHPGSGVSGPALLEWAHR